MSRAGSNGPAPGPRPAPPPNPPAPAGVRMWWDGGDRAITAREKATIEEHGPSSFSIPLVQATAPQPAGLAGQEGGALVTDAMVDAACKILHHGYDHESRKAYREACQKAARQALEAALAATGKQQVGESNQTTVDSGALRLALNVLRRAGKGEVAEALESTAARGQQVGEVQRDGLDVEWLKARVSSIHSTVSLGHQTGPHAYAGEDFGRYLAEAAGDCQEIMRALAARQPVHVQGSDELSARTDGERAAYLEGIEEGNAQAARQPGAQEPVVVEAVATIKRDGDGELYVDWLTEGGIHDLPVGDVLLAANSAITNDEGYGEVYATPPAQGIDLGQFRPVLEHRRDDILNAVPAFRPDGDYSEFNACIERRLAEVERLLAIVDGQRDAAPGVGNGPTCKDPLQVASCRMENGNG